MSTTDTMTNDIGGTYEGLLAGKYHNQYYILLALGRDGTYELYKKEIGMSGAKVYKGSIVRCAHDKIIKLHLDDNLTLSIFGNVLKIGELVLRKVSDAESLNPAYYSYLLKEECSGKNYTVQIYSKDTLDYAEMNFQDEVYLLSLNRENSYEIEYTDGKVFLLWNILDLAPLPNYHPVFYDGKRTYRFSVLSPTNVFM